jgi:Icc-related predicted phosphoesterase
MPGTTLVVCPGRLDRGKYSLVDVRTGTVEANRIATGTTV